LLMRAEKRVAECGLSGRVEERYFRDNDAFALRVVLETQ
jgi:hypothetical protein